MTNYLHFDALLYFLEESLSDKKNEIKLLNKYYKNGKSFLCCTCDFLEVSKKEDIVNYIAIIFQDLPSPYPELILENIKIFAANNKLACEYITWEKYKSYKNPVRL